MKKSPVNIDVDTMGKAVKAFVRERARSSGSSVVYRENKVIVRENPRTGEKTVILSPQKK
jgi:hypothetical protein